MERQTTPRNNSTPTTRRILWMLVIMLLSVSAIPALGQLSGTKTIPGDYATIAAAITDLNTQGVGSGGVTFNVAAGHTETASNLVLGMTVNVATAANPLVFQKSGAGANPLITAAPGVSATLDAVIKLAGADYTTFDGIDVLDPATNTGNAMMERGYAVLRGSSTDGSRNVVIKNCAITLQKINTASIGLYIANRDTLGNVVTAVDSTQQNNFNRFFGNTISNVYNGVHLISASGARDLDNELGVVGEAPNSITNFGGGTITCEGIRCEGQVNVKINNNVINGGAGSGTFVTGILATLFGSGALVPNYEISHNVITLQGGTTNLQYAIRALATGNTVNIHHNTVENSVIPSASAAFRAITHEPTGTTNVANIYDNIIRNNTHAGTGAMNLIYAVGTIVELSIYSNTIHGNQKSGASGTLSCIETGDASVNCFSNTIYDNSIPNSSGATASSVYGYVNNGGDPPSEIVHDNTIYNLSIGGAGTSTSMLVVGIRSSVDAILSSKEIYGNTIHSLSNIGGTSTTGGTYGIYSTAGVSTKIHKNNIYNLSNTGATGTVAGCWASSGTAIEVYNNFISDLRTPNSTNANAVVGLNFTSATTSSTIGAYYNTVYLNASGGTTFGSSGISVTASATPTTAALDLRNNVIVNLSTPGSTSGFTVAYRRSAANLQSYATASNNNSFYAGTPAPNRLIFHDGTNSDQILTDYQARVTPRDVASFSAIPLFVNSSTTPYDLHINTAVASQFESGGSPLTATTTDYDGNLRQNDPGYTGGGTAPDIGADEFEGIALPPMVYVSSTSSQNTNSVFANTTNNHIIGIEIVASGSSNPLTVTEFVLNTNGSTNVAGDVVNAKVFYTGTSNTFGTALQFGSTFVSPPAMPATYSITGSQTLVVGTNYFWLTYDISPTAAGANLVDAEIPSVTISAVSRIPSVTAPAGARSILAALSGTYALAPAQPYPFNSFNNVAAVLGSAGVAGPVTFNVGAGPYNEQVEFTTISGASATNTVTFNGNAETLTFAPTTANRHVIKLNGAQWMRINNLNIVGTAADFGWGIHLTNGANNNTISGCTIDLSAITSTTQSNSAGIVASGSTTGVTTVGNNANHCVISGNTIQGGTGGGPWQGIRLNGNTGGIEGVGNQIINNTIRDFYAEGVTLSNLDTALVKGNDINRATKSLVTIFQGVTINSGCKSVRIEGNRIHSTNAVGANPSATAYGIYFNSVDAPAGSENIAVNNMLYDFSSVTGIVHGVRSSGSDGAHCYFNSILLDNAGSTAGETRGLYQLTTAANVVFRNNIVSIGRAGTGTKHCLFYAAGSTITSNNNVLFMNAPAGTNYIGSLTTNYATLVDWQATGHDTNSVSADPLFVSGTDLHITNPSSPAADAGSPIAGITVDFDNATRNPTTPDIGADEFGGSTTVTVCIPIALGWNIVSLPVLDPISGDSVKYLFTNSINPYAFAFTGSYQQRYRMVPGLGYWIKSSATYTQCITGTRIDSLCVPVNNGWNMIGSISTPIDTSAAHVTPSVPGLRGSNFFRYSAGYVVTNTITPGLGFWVKANGAGFFCLHASSASQSASPQQTGRSIESLNSITIQDANGGTQTLYFGADSKDEIPVDMFAMPPSPPVGSFDARFASADGGTMVQTHPEEVYSVIDLPITLQSSAYPLTITWNVADGAYELNDGATSHTMRGEGTLKITNSEIQQVMLKVTGSSGLPKEFALSQNYPNPFNPTTNVKYALPVDSRVTMEIYNVIGQRVRTLMNDNQAAGYHLAEWDGKNNAGQQLSSGMYFLQLSAKGANGKAFIETRKLMLLK